MDVIEIKGIRALMVIGARAWEQSLLQPIRLDIKYKVRKKNWLEADGLGQTEDYSKVVQTVTQALSDRKRFCLIEAAAEYVAQLLLEHYAQIESVEVKLSKDAACFLKADQVSVVLERSRSEVKGFRASGEL